MPASSAGGKAGIEPELVRELMAPEDGREGMVPERGAGFFRGRSSGTSSPEPLRPVDDGAGSGDRADCAFGCEAGTAALLRLPVAVTFGSDRGT